MDPLSALSVASNVIQFLGFGYKVLERLSEYSNSGPQDVIRSMQGIATLLPLVLNSLSRIRTEADVDKLDTDTRCILRGVLSGCMTLVDEVDQILDKFAHTPGESVAVKIRKVLSSFKYEDKIVEIGKNLQTYIQVLILHHVVDSKEMPSRPLDEIRYFSVPEKRAKDFVPRGKLLETLDAAFADVVNFQRTIPQFVTLGGGQGAGKSQLAREYCYDTYEQGQFQTVFWLKASTPESIRLSLEGVAAVVRRSSEGSRADKIGFVIDFLSKRWHPWLLVLDNYVPEAFEGRDIMAMVPQQGYGAIILTTRSDARLGTSIRVLKYLGPAEAAILSKSMATAIKSQDLPAVKDCIEDGIDVNGKNADGEYFVIQAASSGFDRVVSYLLEAGANPAPPNGNSVLYEASEHGHDFVLEALLNFEDKHEIVAKSRSYDPTFQNALLGGHAGFCRSLISRRGTQLDPEKLFRLARIGSTKGVKVYEEHKMLPDNESGWARAIKLAIWNSKIETARYLIQIYPGSLKSIGPSILASAVDEKSIELVRQILDGGCDPNLADSEGNLPILVAVHNDLEEITRMLLEKGADPTLDGKTGSRSGGRNGSHYSKATSILLSAPPADSARHRKLLRKCMDRAVSDRSCHLILEILEAAESAGENRDVFDVFDPDGRTPILRALKYGDLHLTRWLIKQNFRLDGVTGDAKDSVLHKAARNGYEEVVRQLLERKMDTTIRNRFGNTPLHLAASNGHAAIVSLLLKWSADPNLENRLGETALEMAREEGHWKVAHILGHPREARD